MIEQQGTVVQLAKSMVRVRVGSTSGCTACESGQGCGGGIFARLVPKKPVTLTVSIDSASPVIKVGQKVLLGLPESFFLRWVTLLFGLPLISGLLAAGAAQFIGSSKLFALSSIQVDTLVLLSFIVVAGIVFRLISRGNRSRIEAVDQLVLIKPLSGSCKAESTG